MYLCKSYLLVPQVTLDCTKLEQRTFSLKNIWSVGVASVPRVYDLHVNNPGVLIYQSYHYNVQRLIAEHDNMELTVTQAATEGKLSSSVSNIYTDIVLIRRYHNITILGIFIEYHSLAIRHNNVESVYTGIVDYFVVWVTFSITW